jgi:hypothetical protein
MKPYNRNKKEPKENTPLPNRRKKMFVLEYMWDDEDIYKEAIQRNSFLFRYNEMGVWYPQFAKFIDVDHVIDMIKKDLRSWIMTNQIFYLRMYGGKKWRVKNLATGEYTYLTITNNDVYVTEEKEESSKDKP